MQYFGIDHLVQTQRSHRCCYGHFPSASGHAGSLAFDLSKIGASWNDDEGINRARHTFATFFKCYHRATVMRVKVAFLCGKKH